jgi:hypothetical protein
VHSGDSEKPAVLQDVQIGNSRDTVEKQVGKPAGERLEEMEESKIGNSL